MPYRCWLQVPGAAPIVVMRDGAVVGLMTAETMAEFIVMHGARQARAHRV